MSGEMVPLGSIFSSKSEYNQFMMMMSRPRYVPCSAAAAAAQTLRPMGVDAASRGGVGRWSLHLVVVVAFSRAEVMAMAGCSSAMRFRLVHVVVLTLSASNRATGRFDAKPVGPANPARDDFLCRVSKAEERDEQKYVNYQRSQREQVYTGTAGQPVGGRMHRQFKLNSQRKNEEWTAEDEKAYQKAFGKSSFRPTGH